MHLSSSNRINCSYFRYIISHCKSQFNQVTSRAHRLGATAPVTIETVHVWRELDPRTEEFREQISDLDDEEQRGTSTAICGHCYRSFGNMTLAEEHETRCDRNPESSAEVDPFHLSSVYRDLRPPPPMIINSSDDVECRGTGVEWMCDICNKAKFRTFEEAVEHENNCTDSADNMCS